MPHNAGMPTRPTGEKAGDQALTAAHRAVAAARAARVPAVDAETLARWLYSDSPPRVVDVRSRAEYRYGHVPGAESLPLPELPGAASGRLAGETRPIVCVSGPRAAGAAALLRRHGFDARRLAGGMRAWHADDLATVSGEADTARTLSGRPLAGGPVGRVTDAAGYRRAMETLVGVPATGGNTIEVLRNGDEIFSAMLADMAAARHTVDLLTYVYWTGDVAHRFADTLADRARAGVRVRLLLDAFGSGPMERDLVHRMRRAGVRVEYFRPLLASPLRANHRTHRKVCIRDDTVAFTGGVGIAAEWEGNARHPGEWRDTHFRVRGPAVDGLRAAFIANWIETGNALAEDDERFPARDDDGPAAVQVIRSQAAAAGITDVDQALRALVRLARRRLRVSTAYFVPDRPFLRLLRDAAHRGVGVEVLVPGQHADKRVMRLAAREDFRPLLEAGVRVCRYQQTMLHNKIVTVDGLVACVGSANLNSRSLAHDDEVCLLVHDADVVATLDGHMDEDLALSDELHLPAWRRRRRLVRAKERLAGRIEGWL